MSDKQIYRIRKIETPDGKEILFPMTDNQFKIAKKINELAEAMIKTCQKLNSPQLSTSGDCCLQLTQDNSQSKSARGEVPQ